MAQVIVAVFCVLVSLAALAASFYLPSFSYGFTGPATFPKAIAGLSLFISLGYLTNCLRAGPVTVRLLPDRRQAGLVALFLLYVVMMPFAGFFTSSFAFSVILTAHLTPTGERWKTLPVSLGLTLCTLGLIYFVFVINLNVFLP